MVTLVIIMADKSGGENTDKWKGQDYTGETRRCAVHRLRSVYGVGYAGGYTGLMQCEMLQIAGKFTTY